MAHVTFIDPIDTLSGKITRRHKTTYMVRSAATSNKRTLEKPVFTTVRGKRTTPFSTDEIAHQTKFAAVAAATYIRMQDPSKITSDQEGFRAQSKYKTIRQFVWHMCEEEYENSL